MKDDYAIWISKNYSDKFSSVNQCNKAVRRMVMMFDELTVQTGWANGVLHCWTKDTHGNIVDPTARQFTLPIKYELIANRFLEKDEFEPATGAVFLNDSNIKWS